MLTLYLRTWENTHRRHAITPLLGVFRRLLVFSVPTSLLRSTSAIAVETKEMLATGTRGGLHRVIFVSVGLLVDEVLEAHDRKCCRHGLLKPSTEKAKK